MANEYGILNKVIQVSCIKYHVVEDGWRFEERNQWVNTWGGISWIKWWRERSMLGDRWYWRVWKEKHNGIKKCEK